MTVDRIKQREELRVPARVEVVAGRQKQDILGRPPLAQEPVRWQKRREEECKRVGVEFHGEDLVREERISSQSA